MTVTKDQLDALQRPQAPNAELTYTIGGPVEASVHSSVEAERIGALTRGERQFSQAVEGFRTAMALDARQGLARARFQNHSGERER